MTTEQAQAETATEETKTEEVKAEVKTEQATTEQSAATKTLAGGATEQKTEQKVEPPKAWPDDWRQKMAEHAGAGDAKAVARELKRLERLNDPTAVFGMYRELDNRLNGGGLVKVPGKDAREEEVKAFHKALGVPEDPKGYVENLKLPDGVTLGEQDKALAGDFAAFMHKAGAPQSVMNEAMAWYFKNEEARAANVDQQDDANRVTGKQQLKEEFGASLDRHMNAMTTLFAYAPGGSDMNNEKALLNRLFAGRMADGRIIGDDPDMIRFLVSIAKEVNPVATVVDSADGSGKGLDDEIAEIEKLMRSDRRAYDKDTKKQARYLELLDARSKHRARAA